MTITSTTARSGPYNGNGVVVDFDYTFLIRNEDDVVVTVTSSAGVDEVQTLTTDYTVSGVGSENGGTVTMVVAPATGEKLTLTRATALTQTVDLENRRSVAPEVLEGALDKLSLIVQDLDERIARAPKIGVSASPDSLDQLIADVTGLAAIDTEITTVAGISADVTTVAGIDTEVTTVVGISSDVTTVAGISADVTTVAGIDTEVTTVAGIDTEVTTVAGISADVTALAAGTGGNLTGNWTASGVWDFTSTEAIRVPVGTTEQRPSVPAQGDIRRNTTTGTWEGYDGISWGNLGFNPAAVAADIIPDADSTRAIGSTANRWSEGWFDEVTTTDLSDGTTSIPTNTVVHGSAKAWVNANGVGVVSVRDSLNVSSMTDDAAGTYSFAYTSNMGSSDYAGFVMGSNEVSGGTLGMPQWQGPTAAGAKVREVYNGVGGCSCYFPSPDNYAIRGDREVVSYGIFGDLA
jgi:hypothetical protein